MTNSKTSSPFDRVAILLGTLNGQRFLGEQLDSIAAQTLPSWRVWASDDGSHDGTLAILDHYRTAWAEDRLMLATGPKRGSTANYLSLVCKAEIKAAYYAFADQDDIWEPDKLARAVAWLDKAPGGAPALYCSRTRLIDEAGRHIGQSPLFGRPPHFANALVQNICGGNTMVFNNAARALLREAGADVDVVVPDWWVYMVITGGGGTVFYDPRPTVRYRQHGANMVGANGGWLTSLKRAWLRLQGRSREWNTRNRHALQGISRLLTPENRQILEELTHFRKQGLPYRLAGLVRSGIYRQSWFGNLGLFIEALFRRI